MNILRSIPECKFQRSFRNPSPCDFLVQPEPSVLLREIMKRNTFFYHQSEDEYPNSSSSENESDQSETSENDQNSENIAPISPPPLQHLPPLFPEYLGNLLPTIPPMSMPTILALNEHFEPVDLRANIMEIENDQILVNDEDNENDTESVDLNNVVDPTEISIHNYDANDDYVVDGPIDLSTNISEIANDSRSDEEAEALEEYVTDLAFPAPDLFELPMVRYSSILENSHDYSRFQPYENTFESHETYVSPEIHSRLLGGTALPFQSSQETSTTSIFCHQKPKVSVISPKSMDNENNAVDFTEVFQTICQTESEEVNSNSNEEYYNPIEDAIVQINEVEVYSRLPIKKRPLPPIHDDSDDHLDDEDDELDAEVAMINGFTFTPSLPPKKRFRFD